jgi:hypothetical protein
MPTIPKDIYDRIHELAIDLANATIAEDRVLTETHYATLHAYCDEQAQRGRDCSFLWETLGDFTDDPEQSIIYYRRALALARRDREPVHTILLALGRTYFEQHQFSLAATTLEDARSAAIEAQALDEEGEAAKLLLQLHQ